MAVTRDESKGWGGENRKSWRGNGGLAEVKAAGCASGSGVLRRPAGKGARWLSWAAGRQSAPTLDDWRRYKPAHVSERFGLKSPFQNQRQGFLNTNRIRRTYCVYPEAQR